MPSRKGLKVNVYLEDWSNGYHNSPDYVFGLMDNLKDAGISHFMLPDTLGVMSPEEVLASIGDMCSRYPSLQFDFHPHNDYGLATANVMAAVRAGVSSVHCTVNCLGERAGNASLAEVAVVLRDKMAMELSIDESHIVRISQMVENFSGKRVAANAPIVGADVFTQTAGIHADGDQKGGLYKTRLSPERFSRTRSYALGKMSGKASLKKNLELWKSICPRKIRKRCWPVSCSSAIRSRRSPPTTCRSSSPTCWKAKVTSTSSLLNCSITSGLNLESTASIRVEVNGEKHLAVGSGNGGFDAFIDAHGQGTGAA